MTEQPSPTKLDAAQVVPLLVQLADWSALTTIVQFGGCVFEYKGRFPSGSIAHGYYNFGQGPEGFQGHINLAAIQGVTFQDKLHRGRSSYAFCFVDEQEQVIFKIFLGRDSAGELLPDQVEAFHQIRTSGQISKD